jgi:hypothetical protein
MSVKRISSGSLGIYRSDEWAESYNSTGHQINRYVCLRFTLHERRFTRKRSGSAIAIAAFIYHVVRHS